MIWQDLVITIAIIFSGYALLPQILFGFKHKKKTIEIQTALITTVAIFVITFAFFTLKLYSSAIIQLIVGILWTALLIQSLKYK
jgi:hypothetical protein